MKILKNILKFLFFLFAIFGNLFFSENLLAIFEFSFIYVSLTYLALLFLFLIFFGVFRLKKGLKDSLVVLKQTHKSFFGSLLCYLAYFSILLGFIVFPSPEEETILKLLLHELIIFGVLIFTFMIYDSIYIIHAVVNVFRFGKVTR